jgi:hypothetical protein
MQTNDQQTTETRSNTPSVIPVALIAFIFPGALSGLCLTLCGASLQLFLVGFFFAALIVPPLVLTQSALKYRLLIAACVVDGIGVIWLSSIASPQITFIQWLRCYVVLICYATTLAGVAMLLVRVRIAPIFASAVTTILALIWLTWPVWLSPHLTGSNANTTVKYLTWIHPLFAINGVLANLGTWSHLPIAYRYLTTLGQDIPYTLPTSVWPAALLHVVVGAAVAWVSYPCTLRRKNMITTTF